MSRAAAFFDVDGTLTRSDIFRDLLRFRAQARTGAARLGFLASAPARAAFLLALDRIDRSWSNRAVYRCYRGFRSEELRAWANTFQAGAGLERAFPRGIELLRRHAELGHRLVFVTGSLIELVEPLALRLERLLGEAAPIRVEAAALAEGARGFTGRLLGEPVSGSEKARRAIAVAAEEGLDLSSSHAYGDSMADLKLLEAVGRPAAVNPEARLRRLARRRGWPVLELDRGARR